MLEDKAANLELQVEGMTCGHCEKTVKTALEGVVGPGKARVSLPEGKAWVEGPADPAALISAVAEEGYKARLVSGAREARP
jgi:copper chaperone